MLNLERQILYTSVKLDSIIYNRTTGYTEFFEVVFKSYKVLEC
jgi:hypothetical protein